MLFLDLGYSTSILGPSLFGLTYMKTVATMPAAIFYLSGVVITIAFIALAAVRLPKLDGGSSEDADVEEQEPLLDLGSSERQGVPQDTLVGPPQGLESDGELRARKVPASSSD